MIHLKLAASLILIGIGAFLIFAVIVAFIPVENDPKDRYYWGPGIRISLWEWFFDPYCQQPGSRCLICKKGQTPRCQLRYPEIANQKPAPKDEDLEGNHGQYLR